MIGGIKCVQDPGNGARKTKFGFHGQIGHRELYHKVNFLVILSAPVMNLVGTVMLDQLCENTCLEDGA